MSTVTKPMLLDETGLKILEPLQSIAHNLAIYFAGENAKSLFSYATQTMNFFKGANLPIETIIVDFTDNESLSSMESMFQGVTGCKTVIIKSLKLQDIHPSLKDLINAASIETLVFDDCSFSPSSFQRMCEYNSKIKTIIGELDFSSSTNNSFVYAATKLEDFRAKANSIMVDISMGNPQAFSNETLISVANGLNAEVTGKTLTLHANKKTVCDSLMGTNNNGTFEADAQGTMSLTTFITTVKGWTLA